MALFNTFGFKGRMPASDDATLDDTSATVATNCRIQGGKIKPLYDPLQVIAQTTGGTLKSIYYYRPGDEWLEWTIDVDVVTPQIGEDPDGRIIYSDGTAPKQTWAGPITTGGTPYPGTSYLLGIPPPGYHVSSAPLGIAPTWVVNNSPDDPLDTIDSRYYVVTTVDSRGAEGFPSPPSTEVEWQPGQTVTLTIPVIPVGNYSLASYRVYRTSTGSTSTEFLYVGGGTNFGGAFLDETAPGDLAEALPSEIFDLPEPTMIGLTEMAGGYLAGFFGKVVCFSEIAAPHAWPVQYQLNTKEEVVGIQQMDDNTLLVATRGKPYIAAGTDPASMTLTELPILQSCTSKRSMADVGIGVVYASPDGLVLASRNGTGVLTQGIFSREQWQAYDPTTIEGFAWEGLYICLHTSPTSGGFIINPAAPQGGIVDITEHYTGAYHDEYDDALYVCDGANIKQWDAGITYQTMTWRGKTHELKSPGALGACQLLGDSTDDFTLNIYADGDLHKAYTVTEGKPKKLKAGYKARKVQVEVVSKSTSTGGSLHGIRTGTTMKDLRK